MPVLRVSPGSSAFPPKNDDSGLSALLWRARLRFIDHATTQMTSRITAAATPIPMPAFEPADKPCPFESATGLGCECCCEPVVALEVVVRKDEDVEVENTLQSSLVLQSSHGECGLITRLRESREGGLSRRSTMFTMGAASHGCTVVALGAVAFRYALAIAHRTIVSLHTSIETASLPF